MYDLDKNPNPLKDQHFLVSEEVLEQIYDVADIQDGESIVEIGGGSGAITDFLVRGNNHVTVIEKDPYYASYLREKYKDYSNVTVIEGDALEFNYCDYDRILIQFQIHRGSVIRRSLKFKQYGIVNDFSLLFCVKINDNVTID